MAGAPTHGMNPDEVEALGNFLKNAIRDQIHSLCTQIEGRVHDTTWVGQDATTFKTQWWPEHKQHLMAMADQLSGFGQSAINNASEQRQVSGR